MCLSETSQSWQLQGILSYHENCGKSQHPPIYTKIGKEMKRWMADTIGFGGNK